VRMKCDTQGGSPFKTQAATDDLSVSLWSLHGEFLHSGKGGEMQKPKLIWLVNVILNRSGS